MAKRKPKTKAGKRRKMGKVMGEFKRGTLRSSSGKKVTSRKQAIAIGLSESGQSRRQRPKTRRRKARPKARRTAKPAAKKRKKRK